MERGGLTKLMAGMSCLGASKIGQAHHVAEDVTEERSKHAACNIGEAFISRSGQRASLHLNHHLCARTKSLHTIQRLLCMPFGKLRRISAGIHVCASTGRLTTGKKHPS